MSPELMYVKFLDKVNKGSSGGGIDCDKEKFTRIVNECKNRWVEKGIKDKDSVLIDSFQEIVKTKNISTSTNVKKDYIEFQIPEDFYEGILAKCNAKKGSCKKVLYSREVKNQNKNFLQFDEASKPDFNWEWVFHSIQENKIRIYRTDFDITSVVFEYYQIIPDIQMEGTVDIEGNLITTSVGIDILSDQYVDQIINLSVKEFEMNYMSQPGVQISQERINSQE